MGGTVGPQLTLPHRLYHGGGGGHMPKACGVKRKVKDHDLAAQKAPEGHDRQTDTHTIHPLYDDILYLLKELDHSLQLRRNVRAAVWWKLTGRG